jgi:hypothetical protein
MREKDTKTHQKRTVDLDDSTVAVLQEHLMRQDQDAAALGLALDGRAFLFSLDADCERSLMPDSVTSEHLRRAATWTISLSPKKVRTTARNHPPEREWIRGTQAGQRGSGGLDPRVGRI